MTEKEWRENEGEPAARLDGGDDLATLDAELEAAVHHEGHVNTSAFAVYDLEPEEAL